MTELISGPFSAAPAAASTPARQAEPAGPSSADTKRNWNSTALKLGLVAAGGGAVLLGIGGTFVLGIGALAFGVLLMFLWFAFPRSKPFFRGESLNRETPVLVPDDPADYVRSVDGGV